MTTFNKYAQVKYALALKKAAVRAALVKLAVDILDASGNPVRGSSGRPEDLVDQFGNPLIRRPGRAAETRDPKAIYGPQGEVIARTPVRDPVPPGGRRFRVGLPRSSTTLAAKPLLERIGLALRGGLRRVGFLGPARLVGRYPRTSGLLGLGLGAGLGLGSLSGLGSLAGSLFGGGGESSGVEVPTAVPGVGIDPRLLMGGGALLGAGVGAVAGDRKDSIRNALIGLALGGAAGYGAGRML